MALPGSDKQQDNSPPPVDQMEEEDFGNNFSSELPPEIWTRIFELAQPQEPKTLSKVRLVCQQWRDIVNENFEMKVKINDGKMSISDIQRFKKVSQCIVSEFVGEVPKEESLQIFWDPNLIKSLIIRGSISRQNFLRIVDQCHAVTELIFTGAMLTKEENMFESDKLGKFTNGIKKLVVTGVYIDKMNLAAENYLAFLKCPMPNLTSLTVRAQHILFDEDPLFSFIGQCRDLETLELNLTHFNSSRREIRRNIEQMFPFSNPSLTTVKIECRTSFTPKDWLPFLKAQNSLKYLRLFVETSTYELFTSQFQQFQDILLQNKLSLEHLELGIIDGGCEINSENVFQRMTKLKTLKLEGEDVSKPLIRNTRFLPVSIQHLELKNFRRHEYWEF